MYYDLAVSDFDGTLLEKGGAISSRTVVAIDSFRKAGGKFILSTGRSFSSIVQRLEELGLHGDMPVLCCQGALMRRAQSGETLLKIPMQKQAALAFLQKAEERDLMCQFYTAEAVYAPCRNARNEEYFTRTGIDPVEVGMPVSEFLRSFDEPVLKVLCIIPPDERARLLRAFSEGKGCAVFASQKFLIEAVSEQAGKGNGLVQACRALGVDCARSVAFGDELNDIDMLKAAGLGVAVGNAVPEAKAAADFVCDACADDGVAKVLERIVRGERITHWM